MGLRLRGRTKLLPHDAATVSNSFRQSRRQPEDKRSTATSKHGSSSSSHSRGSRGSGAIRRRLAHAIILMNTFVIAERGRAASVRGLLAPEAAPSIDEIDGDDGRASRAVAAGSRLRRVRRDARAKRLPEAGSGASVDANVGGTGRGFFGARPRAGRGGSTGLARPTRARARQAERPLASRTTASARSPAQIASLSYRRGHDLQSLCPRFAA